MKTARRRSSLTEVGATLLFARRDVDATLSPRGVQSLGAFEDHEVNIADGRAYADRLSLDDTGFALVHHASALSDFSDNDALRTRYVLEMETLIAEITGAVKVIVVHKALRGSKEILEPNPRTRVWDYAFKAHIDGDGSGLFDTAALVDPAATAKYRNCAFAAYNIWRPVMTVEQYPLAVCDASTVSIHDLVPAFYDGWDDMPPEQRPEPIPASGSYFHLAYNPTQRWYYFPEMKPDEVLVFKQWDTERQHPLCVPHCAFEHPETPPNAAPRLSVEARAVAFFNEPQRDPLLALD